MSKQVIRLATVDDAPHFAGIYAPIVLETSISFEIEPPSAEEFANRIKKTLVAYPWLCCEVDGEIAGYAYAGLHRERAAYQWTTEVSAYIAEKYRGQGIGKELYTSLFKILEL